MSNKGKKPIFVSPTISFQRKNNFLIVSNTNREFNLKKKGGWENKINASLMVKFTAPLTVSINTMTRQSQVKVLGMPHYNDTVKKRMYKQREEGKSFNLKLKAKQRDVQKVSIISTKIYKQINKKKQIKSSWGTLRTLLYNTILGLYKTHTIKFRLVGVGYKANLKKNVLILRLGFSHRHFFRLPSKILLTKIKKRPPTFLIKGSDLDLIKNTAFILRSFKKPEPYKGKGVALLNELAKLKEGKKTKTS